MGLLGSNCSLFKAPVFIVCLVGKGKRRKKYIKGEGKERKRNQKRKAGKREGMKEGTKEEGIKKIRGKIRSRNFN